MKKLYRRNNNGKPTVWWAEICGINIKVHYGIVGSKIRNEIYNIVMKNANKELESKYNDKIKVGYKYLDEICDMGESPVEDVYTTSDHNNFYNFLNTYLPKDLTNGNNLLLPMLAKTYNGNVWKNVDTMIGQYKINGLRCIITAYAQNDIFNPIRLRFQSREGTIWNSLNNLEDYLIHVIPRNVIEDMIEGEIALDGEIYLPGYKVNEINHFVKDPTCKENKLLQFWCYDIIMESNQLYRSDYRYNINTPIDFNSFEQHINNTNRLIILKDFTIKHNDSAIEHRNRFINLGFEGLILRNPYMEYQYGRRRANYMEKFKDAKEGDFIIVDIYKENKRNLPILLCKNDINEEVFETRLSTTHNDQQYVLTYKKAFIGKTVHIHYGERSGVGALPFHIKDVIINGNT